MKSGPHVPYDVSPLARDVGKLYDLPWIVYQRYAYRKHEKVEKLSTSTAPVAARWAWSFRLGEILTDLNAHARMLVASRTYAKEHSIQVVDAYDKLYDQAIEIARATGGHASSENAPDVLRLPDKLPLAHVGALVELTVDVSKAQKQCSVAIHDAGAYIRAVADGEYTEQDALVGWNNSYIDIRLDPSIIKSYRIVIKGMHSWEQDVIERMIQEGKLRG